MTLNDSKRPARPIRRALLALVLIAIFGVGMHLAAPAANGINIAGLPLGYAIAAQVGPLLLALVVLSMAGRARS